MRKYLTINSLGLILLIIPILYLLTLGLCYIGTIIDLVNYRKLAFEYNQEVAARVLRAAVAMN